MSIKNLLSIILCLLFSYTSNAQFTLNPMQYWRPYDQKGINVFETGKEDTISFDGIKVRIGGNFTQQFQNLRHSNRAATVLDNQGRNINQLMEIGGGFNLATANLNLDVQLADGVRVNLTTYLSSRHHPEAWVKSGFLQIDKMPFLKSEAADKIMKYVTLKLGHMEINYGDAHFRRTDNGNAFYNPFVGNLIMDAFTTEIGGELYFQKNGFIAMIAATDGEIRGDVTNPNRRKIATYGKLGFDKKIKNDLRARLTGSIYHTGGSVNNTLYGGDRAGSRYYMVLENFFASTSSNFTSGRINPGFNNKITSFVINPFLKYKGLEVFGNIEFVQGQSRTETSNRNWNQYAGDIVYRFGKAEKYYVGGRYNYVNGKLAGTLNDVSADRLQLSTGWFITKNILAKLEYVRQQYRDYPTASIFHQGKFNGVMLEGVIAF